MLSDRLVDDILQQMQTPDANLLVLLGQFKGSVPHYWQQDMRLYRAFGRALISAGHPTEGSSSSALDLKPLKMTPPGRRTGIALSPCVGAGAGW